MIEIKNSENSPLVEISISGKISHNDSEAMDVFFEEQVSEETPIQLLLMMENWDGMTFKGLLEDIKMIKYTKKMNKVAIVAHSNFLKANAKLGDLLPGIEVEYFELNETTSARRWLNQSEEGKTFLK